MIPKVSFGDGYNIIGTDTVRRIVFSTVLAGHLKAVCAIYEARQSAECLQIFTPWCLFERDEWIIDEVITIKQDKRLHQSHRS